jgi:AbrB family looped-hinge helix DNA binding protein
VQPCGSGGEIAHLDSKPSEFYTDVMESYPMTIGGNAMRGSTLSLVQERGQVTIPAQFRKKYGIEKGDIVAFVDTADGLVLKRREVVATETLQEIGRMLREQGVELNDLLAGATARVEAAEDPFAVLDEMREAFKDVPPDEIEREVAKAVAEVRAERRGAVQSPGSA